MSKYRVTIQQTYHVCRDFYVEAADVNEAIENAQADAANSAEEWGSELASTMPYEEVVLVEKEE